MENNKDNLLKELNYGKNLEVNLPRFANELMSDYYESSLIQLTMNYYTYYEVVTDEVHLQDEQVVKLTKFIHDIIKDSILTRFDTSQMEVTTKKLEQHRAEIIKKIQVLTTYTDILQNYEYVLNRLELKYTDAIPVIEDEIVVQEIINYIFNTNDNVIINDKIKEIIGQLPIRMTKLKFYDLLSNSLSIYNSADKSSVDNYIYMIKTSAMLYCPEGIETEFPNLTDFVRELAVVDFKNLEEESYNLYVNRLKIEANYINSMVDVYISIQEIVNNLFTLVLATPYMLNTDEKIEKECKDILKEINKRFLLERYENIPNVITEKLVITEGIQEKLFYKISGYESVLYEIETNQSKLVDSLMLRTAFNSLYICQKLMSSSLFMKLENEQETKIADEKYIKSITKSLIDEFADLFNKNNQSVNRAIMVNVISKMPILFHDINEVVDYIKNSLTSCTDNMEKATSISIIRQIMK